jgi:S1-C subfamily serine protease
MTPKYFLLFLILSLAYVGCSPSNGSMPESLESRYQLISDGVVIIISRQGNRQETGTGFFVDTDGTLVTAAHVLFDRTYYQTKDGKIAISLVAKPNLQILFSDGRLLPLNIGSVSDDYRRNAAADLAVIKKGVNATTPRFLNLRKGAKLPLIGESVIAIGFPASSVEHKKSSLGTVSATYDLPAKVLYRGFVSSIYVPQSAIGVLESNVDRPVYQKFPFLQIQMPIIKGVSGSPLIDDDNDVVGVITAEPEAFPDGGLTKMIRDYAPGIGLQGATAPDPNQTRLAALGWALDRYFAPGSGLAVPASLLDSSELASGVLEARPQVTEAGRPVSSSPPH